jgi:uncharacterized protein (TIGR03083 family)
METNAHVEHLRREAAALAAAVRAGTTEAVPSCPGWTVADLVEHVGRVHRWVVRSIEAPTDQRVPFIVEGDPEPGDDLAAWYEDRIAELMAELDRGDFDRVVATFVGPRPLAWWARRQSHEVAVHRWDAEHAHGTPTPIDAAAASDGVDEFLDTFVARRPGKFAEVAGSLHLHCTDVEGEWVLRPDGEALQLERVHAKGDVAVRGPASDLFLLTWGRAPASSVEVLGDGAVLDRFLTASRI